MIELQTNHGNAWLNPQFISSIDFQEFACFIRCDGADYRVSHDQGNALLAKINEKTESVAAVDANQLQVRAITQVERKETYSKTAKKNFSFWACTLEGVERVNVFDHPDPERNTWNIAKEKGWSEWTTLGEGVSEFYDVPIPCVVSHDGKWYSLVNIMQKSDYHTEYRVIDLDESLEPLETESSESD